MAIEEIIRLDPQELRLLIETIEYDVFKGAREESHRLGRYIAPEEYQPDVMRLLKGTKDIPDAAEDVEKYIGVLKDESEDLKIEFSKLEDELEEKEKEVEKWRRKYNRELDELRDENEDLHLRLEELEKLYAPLDHQGAHQNRAIRSLKNEVVDIIQNFERVLDIVQKLEPYDRPVMPSSKADKHCDGKCDRYDCHCPKHD